MIQKSFVRTFSNRFGSGGAFVYICRGMVSAAAAIWFFFLSLPLSLLQGEFFGPLRKIQWSDLAVFEFTGPTGIDIAPQPWIDTGKLPFFLRDLYDFFQATLLDTPCLLMIATTAGEETPASINKHMTLVQKAWGGEIIYVHARVSSYNRKRLIEHKVPFIIPGNQMYLPQLGIDLREHFKRSRVERSTCSPSTQTVILYAIRHGTEHSYTPSTLAPLLGYTPMTMTRAFDELQSIGLGAVITTGKQRVLRFQETPKSLWEKSRQFLLDPVKKRMWFTQLPSGCQPVGAGLTALAQCSTLAAPSVPVYALGADDWGAIKQRNQSIIQLNAPESGACELEIWSYSPQLLAEANFVDKFSLYLSLRKTSDERVEMALQQMMETISW